MPPAPRTPFAGGYAPPAGIDLDYLYYLQHIRLVGDSYVVELPAQQGLPPPAVLDSEAPSHSSSSHGECVSDPSTAHVSIHSGSEGKGSSASLEAPLASYGSVGDGDAVEEDYRTFLQHTRLVDGQLILEKGGRVINYDQPAAPRSGGSGGEAEKKRRKRRAEEVDSPGAKFGVGGDKEGVALRSPATPVPGPYACDWQADPKPGQEAAGTEKGVDWEESSINGRGAGLRSVAEGIVEKEPGVIWPAHLNQRPDSDFKRRLIQVLEKPATRKEYFKLFDMVTLRKPLVKLRQVRKDVKFYPTEEMGSSYLDHYPDLAEQIMNTGSCCGLALLRGFVFWLQNNVHEDQFMPWVDDSRGPEIIPLVD